MKLLYKGVNYSLFLSCFTLVFSFHISTIAIILFSFLSLLYSFKTRINFQKRNWKKLLILPTFIFLIPVLGIFYTEYVSKTVDLLVKYLPYLIVSISYFYADEKIKESAHNYIKLGFIVGVATVLVYLLIHNIYNFSINKEQNLIDLFSYKYAYKNFLKPIGYHATYIGLLVLVSNFFVYRQDLKIWIKTILLIINICGIFFIMSKIIIVLFAIQILILFFTLKSKKIKMAFFIIFFFMIGGVYYLYKNHLKDIYILQRLSVELAWDLNNSNSSSSINGRVKDDSRLARWKVIFEQAQDKFWSGHGSGSEKSVLQEVYKNNNLEVSLKRRYNTHNQFLFFMLENGIFGLLILLFFFYLNVHEAIRNRDFFTLYFLTALFLICMVENYLNRTMGVLAVSIFLTFMKKNNEENRTHI